MSKCKLCADNLYNVIKLKCKHEMCISCLLSSYNLKCKLCQYNFYDELSDEMLNILILNIRKNLN